MGLFRKYCTCGSGLEQGFCSHRGATRAGTTQNGKRTSGGEKIARPSTPKKPKR